MKEVDGAFITRAEIQELADKLDHVRDLVPEMAIALTGQSAPSSSESARSQPRSRPPYPMHLEALVDELGNELSTTIRHMCETRGMEYSGSSGLWPMAQWIIRYRFALAMMPDAVELFDGLVSIVDRCQQAMNQSDREIEINPTRIEAANRQIVTGPQVEKLAHHLGDQGKGLTERRVKYLRNKGFLAGQQDRETGTWFYRLGNVLAADQKARTTRARPKVIDA